METEIKIKEEESRALREDEELIRREEGQDDVWATSKFRKNVEKCIKVLEQQQTNGQTNTNNLIYIDLVRLNLLSQNHPFIRECQKLIKPLPKVKLKRITQTGTTTK
jgi:hypothetical protein